MSLEYFLSFASIFALFNLLYIKLLFDIFWEILVKKDKKEEVIYVDKRCININYWLLKLNEFLSHL